MGFPFYIARRYLFSEKSHHAINLISLISVCGVVVATAALVCALSVMNGFHTVIFSMFGNLDPELKITPRTGKVFRPDSATMRQLKEHPSVCVLSEVLQDNALTRYRERQVIATVKGVDAHYRESTSIDGVLIDGQFILRDEVTGYATLGIGLASALGVNAGFTAPLEIYAPKRDEQVNLINPSASFNVEYCYITGVFRTDQQAYDEALMLVPIELTRSLFNYENEVSAIELRLKDKANPTAVKKQIRNLLGENYLVNDRYEQQETSYRMMQSEKWMIFLILCFILVIALFNMVGSLSMLMIEKQDDIRTLRSLGADDFLIRRIFLLEGWMISAFGAITGVALGLILCILQEELGLIKMGEAGTFVIDNYPVEVAPTDLLVILAAVLSIGFLSAWYPVYYLGDRWIRKP
ncbi:MAG: ABC transporter permease [Tannerellaceae bacterium]|jgi:lipoprotein-releasing system permease protein/zinc transport system substrate-binding protein|nr:ABC transporter permease [Tannerellaceae bacterium]